MTCACRGFHRVRWFRPKHGYDFPLIPRRIGMAMQLAEARRDPRRYPATFYKVPWRVFEPLFSAGD